MKLIGISGKAGVGKTTLANILRDRLGPRGVSVWPMAMALREDVAATFGFSLQEVVDPAFKTRTHRIGERDMTGRELLQCWGGVRRNQHRNVWVDMWLLQADALSKVGQKFLVCDDVRYPNEADLIRWDVLIRLEPYPGWQSPCEAPDHTSETALDRYPFKHVYQPALGGLDAIADLVILEVARA